MAEKGGSDLEQITAHPNFFILATMNPGGDYGKKELSPALRNRFTEIWVPPVSDLNELKSIAQERYVNQHKMSDDVSSVGGTVFIRISFVFAEFQILSYPALWILCCISGKYVLLLFLSTSKLILPILLYSIGYCICCLIKVISCIWFCYLPMLM